MKSGPIQPGPCESTGVCIGKVADSRCASPSRRTSRRRSQCLTIVSSMIRREQQGRRQLRRAEREAARRIETNHGSYRPPDRADCYTKQWITPGDDAYRLRLQTITWRHQGRLTDFVINAQVLTAIQWETVEYIDCCHGHCPPAHPK